MIIVSQDKDEIVNFDNITSIVVCDVWDDKPGQVLKATDIRGSRHSLGYYKDEERAKEVLNEIVKTYSSYMQLNGGPAIIQGQSDIAPAIFNIPKVYKMPEE